MDVIVGMEVGLWTKCAHCALLELCESACCLDPLLCLSRASVVFIVPPGCCLLCCDLRISGLRCLFVWVIETNDADVDIRIKVKDCSIHKRFVNKWSGVVLKGG